MEESEDLMEFVTWVRLQWDRVLGVVGAVVGILLLAVGWRGVSDTEYIAGQIPYLISAGLGGLIAMMIGGTLWLSADLKDEWRALDGLEPDDRTADDVARLEARIEELTERLEAIDRAGSNGGAAIRTRKPAATGQKR
jgi:hypothetical protein